MTGVFQPWPGNGNLWWRVVLVDEGWRWTVQHRRYAGFAGGGWIIETEQTGVCRTYRKAHIRAIEAIAAYKSQLEEVYPS